jgi:hypothetical protein
MHVCQHLVEVSLDTDSRASTRARPSHVHMSFVCMYYIIHMSYIFICVCVYVYVMYILYVSAHEPGLRIAYLEHVIAQVCVCVYMYIIHHTYIAYILCVSSNNNNNNIGNDEHAAARSSLPIFFDIIIHFFTKNRERRARSYTTSWFSAT